MTEIEQLYPNINLNRLKSVILNWAQHDALITRVTLYLNSEPEPPYILIAELPPFPEEKTKARQLLRKRYRAENEGFDPKIDAYPSNFYPPEFEYTDKEEAVIDTYASTSEDCAHLEDLLSQVYEGNPPDNYIEKWMWINIVTGEELYEPRNDTKYIVYEKGDEVEVRETRSPLPVKDYIGKRKSEGASDGQIAAELFDKKGPYHMSAVQVGRLFGMDYNLNEGQLPALRMRVRRAIEKSRETTSNKS